MPRAPRDEEPGAIHHVTAHSLDGGRIVVDDADRNALLEDIGTVVSRQRWTCLACCILDTHYHLLLATPEPNLGDGMRWLNGAYAQRFNRRHARRGHLFRERYRNRRVRTDAHLLLTVRYIARNRMAAGLVPDPAADPWSSYPGIVGRVPCWAFVARQSVLELFGGGPAATARLEEFVAGDADAPPNPS